MTSGLVEQSPDTGGHATSAPSWTKRVLLGTLGTAGATIALGALAASAFANAANPTSAQSTEHVNDNGSVLVTVSGSWSWGELAGVQTSPQQDCAGRSGVGWSVDWWGMSNSSAPTAGKGPISGSLVNPAASKTTPPSLTAGGLSVADTWQVKSGPSKGQYFHTSHQFNGFLADLCKNATPTPTGPVGSYTATALYPNIDAVPAQICVNFYDPHGKQGDYSTSPGDNFADQANDNSITTNSFDPTNVSGNCSVPVIDNPLSVKVDKTNDANQDGNYSTPETANSIGQAVKFQVVVTNNSQTTEVVDSGTDAFGGNSFTVCDGSTGHDGLTADDNIVGSVLAPGAHVTCKFTLANYSKATDVTNTVTIPVHEQNHTGNKTSGQSSSTVLAGSPNLDVKKFGPSTGIASQTGDYELRLINNGNATAPGTTTFYDRLPAGETFVSFLTSTSDNGMNCTAAGQLVTCTYSKDLPKNSSASAWVRVRYDAGTEGSTLTDCVGFDASKAVPGTSRADQCVSTDIPKILISKRGPDTGVPGGSGSYTIDVTNNGPGSISAANASAVSFLDNLPDGETFLGVATGSDYNCSETANPKVISCTAKSGRLPLAKNGTLSVTVLVTYALTAKNGDVLTDCAVLPNLDKSCKPTIIHTPDVVIGKTGPATGVAGGKGTYTITVKNNGAAAANNVVFTDTLPVGESYDSFSSSLITCSLSANPQVVNCSLNSPLNPGASASVDVTVSYGANTAGMTLTDCAALAPDNKACVPTKIPGEPALVVTKTNDANGDGVFHDSETATNPGDSVTFKVVVTNSSAVPVAIDSVVDVYSVTSVNECASLIGTVLASGDSVTCTFTIAGYAPAAGSSLLDTVTVIGHDNNNPGKTVQDSDTSVVKTRTPQAPGPDLAIVKTADKDTVRAGDTLTYTLAVSNVGDGPTTGRVTVTDSIPSGLDMVSVDGGNSWDCTVSGRFFSCLYLGGDLAAGASAADVITVVTTVNDTASIRVINTGVVDTPGDVNPDNDRSTVKTPVTQVLPEKIVKTPPTAVLPYTGSNATSLLPVGLLMVLFGAALLGAARRRRTQLS